MQRKFTTVFGTIARPFAGSDSLFFDSLLSAEQINRACQAAGHRFRDRVYSPAVTLWMFLGQVLSADHSCRDAVVRLNVWRVARGQKPCASETTSYCQARQRLPESVPRDLMRSTGQELVNRAEGKWLWKGRHVKIVDGTTVTMPDTAESQREYPQPSSQQPGLGFPIARMVVVMSLAVGSVLEVAMSKYTGKQTGETSLLRTLLETILPGEILLADSYYGTYWLFLAAWEGDFGLLTRTHCQRKIDFRRGRKLGPLDHIVTYRKTKTRPEWMSRAAYAAAPPFILVRHLRFRVEQKGFRTKWITVATTLLDPDVYRAEDLADLYRQRWTVEVDIRSLKTHLQMDHLRCKSPSTVRKEIYCHLLAYNLARTAIAESAAAGQRSPHQLSFKGAVQAMNAFLGAAFAGGEKLQQQYDAMLNTIADNVVGNRPNRVEPRAKKRRPKQYKLLRTPRAVARRRAA